MKIKAGEFKAKCLKLMEEVNRTHEEIVITKRGKPIAKLVPISAGPQKSIFGYMKGKGTILGDIVSPLGIKWKASE